MTTPIFDFIENYKNSDPVRFHMPGHKGVKTKLGIEDFDITEFVGADELFAPNGIIAQSEENAGKIFGAHTFYSTEGSSLSIRAMLFLLAKWCRIRGKEPKILAARNAHKTYVNAAALLNIETEWIMGKTIDSYEVCRFTPEELNERLFKMSEKPDALYVTSPDYLGNTADIRAISDICHKNGVLLLVDNAHGAYLKFLTPSQHPMDLGADMCADSAHKTLPVLTGGAYLHISQNADSFFVKNAKSAFEMFASTSPSYLIMASLDLANEYMESLTGKLANLIPAVRNVKKKLKDMGYELIGNEELKISVQTNGSCVKITEKLVSEGIFPEYYDENHLVLMVTTENSPGDFDRLLNVMTKCADFLHAESDCLGVIRNEKETLPVPKQEIAPGKAIYLDYEELPAEECKGRILASAAVSCPPAVSVYMIGERIDDTGFAEGTLKVIKE